MDFQEFIRKCEAKGYGIAAFNTYNLKGENCCYIMIAQKGYSGRFMKEECKVSELNQCLDFIFERLLRLTTTV